MDARRNEGLIEELKLQVAAVRHLIEEIIHLDSMRLAFANAEKALSRAKHHQKIFFDESKVTDFKFLNETQQGQEHQKNIDSCHHDVTTIQANIKHLETQRDIRMKPINELVEHVSFADARPNQQTANVLLNWAESLNPEGTIRDKIKMIGSVIFKIITLHFGDIIDMHETQKKRNAVHLGISGLFKQNNARELPNQPMTNRSLGNK